MDVANKINYLIEEKGMTKREFARKLSALEPRLKRTGMVPSEQTIYGYLNGKREIKVELIPYIADVLGVKEQELFSEDIEYVAEYNVRYSAEVREIIDLLYYAPKPLRLEIRELLKKVKETTKDGLKSLTTQIRK